MSDQKTCSGCNETSREALVSWDMDDEGGHTYTGRISANHWNGFAAPAFTAEEARRIAANSAGVQGLVQIEEQAGGAFLLTSEDDDPTLVEAQPCCGLFFIGDWWTWGEVSAELGDMPQYTHAHLTEI